MALRMVETAPDPICTGNRGRPRTVTGVVTTA
jgi:hypothetical protein